MGVKPLYVHATSCHASTLLHAGVGESTCCLIVRTAAWVLLVAAACSSSWLCTYRLPRVT